jgi:pimeloyl-ACP methyl ester carboxylesterase
MKVKKFNWVYAGIGLGVVSAALIGLGYKADIPLERVTQKYADGASRFASIDGMRVHYRDEGQGPVVLLIHGSNSSLHTWDGWVTRLLKKYRLVRLDLPGHGLTGPNPISHYDYGVMSHVVDSLMQTLGIEKFAIAGNSMGGAIALDYAGRHPEKVEKLILIDAIGYPDEIPPLALRMWGFPVIGNILTVITPRSVYQSTLREAYGDRALVNDALVDRYYELLLRQGNRRATRDRFAEGAFSISVPILAKIHVKTLVLWGGKDRWFPVSFGERFARDIEGARLKVYPGLGHVPMEEGPEVTARDVDEFLSVGHS